MQILNTNDFISSESVRVADLGKYLLINSVPYDKITNSPIPFANISMVRQSYLACGEGMHPCFNKTTATSRIIPHTSSSQTFYAVCGKHVIKRFKNTLIDNVNPNIMYVFPSSEFRAQLDQVYNQHDDENIRYKFYKIIDNGDGTFTKSSNYILNSANVNYSSSNNSINTDNICHYMTQTNTHVFCFITMGALDTTYSTTGFAVQYMLKIDKETLNIELCPISTYSNYPDYIGNSSYFKYNEYLYNTIQVIHEQEDGLILFGSFNDYSDNRASTLLKPLFYSFQSNKITLLECTGEPLPYGYSLNNAKSVSVSSSAKYLVKVCEPSIALKNQETNEVYTYLFDSDKEFSTTDPAVDSLYYITISSDNVLKMNFKKLSLVFPPELEITALPYDLTYQNTYSYEYEQDQFAHKTLVTNFDGKEYVHLFFTGVTRSPINSRGIYTFEIDEEHTTATLTAFYPALGGTLSEYMLLSSDRKQICIATANSYHFLKFDTVSKKWISTFDSMQTLTSIIKTPESKIYAILSDDSVICHDLSGAVSLDFNFEKAFYEYNNSDVNSYITVWAKNAEDEYAAVNIKLTIAGNCVWQSNGSQTLETTTSAEGPTTVPFTIKGQTAINVSIDAIV